MSRQLPRPDPSCVLRVFVPTAPSLFRLARRGKCRAECRSSIFPLATPTSPPSSERHALLLCRLAPSWVVCLPRLDCMCCLTDVSLPHPLASFLFIRSFASSLSQVEQFKGKLGIVDWGVATMTLEEVFIKLSREIGAHSAD